MAKRVVCMTLLPGQPNDGTGRVCIHLVIRDREHGTYIEPHMLQPVYENGEQVKQKVTAGPERARLACSKTRSGAPVKNARGVTTVTVRTDDPRGVTCPKCMATTEYAEMMKRYKET